MPVHANNKTKKTNGRAFRILLIFFNHIILDTKVKYSLSRVRNLNRKKYVSSGLENRGYYINVNLLQNLHDFETYKYT